MRERDPREQILVEYKSLLEDVVYIVCQSEQDRGDAHAVAAISLLRHLERDPELAQGNKRARLKTIVARAVRWELYRKEARRERVQERHPGRLKRDSGLVGDIYCGGQSERFHADAADRDLVGGAWQEIWKEPMTGDFAEESDSRLVVEEWLAALPPIFADVVRRHVVLGQTYRTIADSTGIPVGTIQSRYGKALKRLKTYLLKGQNMSEDLSRPDALTAHLYPPFKALAEQAIAEATAQCRGKFAGFVRWEAFETYRSPARQEWLFAQGRTRPGLIVTHIRAASGFHPLCLAVDAVWIDPQGTAHWDGPDALWQQFGHCVRAAGLHWGGDGWGGTFRDMPHIEPTKAQAALWRPKAVAWAHLQGLSTP